jgi:putative addiction module component (TIGR02574 family)
MGPEVDDTEGRERAMGVMANQTVEITGAALALPPDERLELADALYSSVPPSVEVEAYWAAEVERRIAAFRAGDSKLYTLEEVFSEYDDE